MPDSDIKKIAFVGDYLPRKCGIATFTHDMHASVAGQFPDAECFVVPVNDHPEGYDYPPEVRFEIDEQDLNSYLRAADFLNFANTDVVCLQHEYGIYGGPAGSHILGLLRDLRMPIVTTLHTVLSDPNADQRRVLMRLVNLSSRVVVMTERARTFLQEIYSIPEAKIDLIAHGIPDTPFVDPNPYKDQFGVEGRLVALTFGLLSPNKGIEHMLRAVPEILKQFPNFVYIVLGATHPDLVREHGERYRLSLERLARDLGIKNHVIFYNRFVELNQLTEFIRAADVYVTPYLNPAQITSGTLAYSFGCGKAIVSTPYWHAEELLAEGRGVIVPFADPQSLAKEICGLLRDDSRRLAMCKHAYELGREMIWERSAHHYMESFQRARHGRQDQPFRPLTVRTLAEQQSERPLWRLDHLSRMTDSTGMFQHATYTIPNFAEGYCTDDNARALLLTVLLEELGYDGLEVRRIATTTAAFLQAAFDHERKRFRNFMSFDRQWLEKVGSEDSHGRAVWALGVCVGRSRRSDLPAWAASHFELALPPLPEMTSPRAWAFGLLGIHEYLARFSGDRVAGQIRDALTTLLVDLYDRTATSDWPWFEEILAYDNARLPHALIAGGRDGGNPRALEIGLRALTWLVEVQRAPQGHFRAIGCHGFYRKGQTPARFDQQPIEAAATVAACLEAYRATQEPHWVNEARSSFEWFLGRNDLGQELYDPATGGCCDGLQEDRINRNQGAESTLAFLLSLAEMNLLESSLAAFRQAR
ncbi:glycosyltransferase family 4 protein [Singulisphaera acidiphila]|uniref:Glycosyltransferase n=2 Tax=Singulisphaera acidiphila TaxID=466153 RepID=L0DGE1_SINAD|nr:glycosyltransferase family 4 protein [Singulisphaera acidiphila]AGA27863.1 glycosyltransferase [Singulisphaera acidiphila DSM 18658]